MGKIIALSEDWYTDYMHQLAIIGAEGTAVKLEEAVKKYKQEKKLKLDFSPRIPQGYFDMWVGNIYEPKYVCTLQACQNNDKEEMPYTTIVCTGIKESCIEAALEFAEICKFEPKALSKGFINSLEDQKLFRMIYDKFLIVTNGGVDAALLLFAAALKKRQDDYRILSVSNN